MLWLECRLGGPRSLFTIKRCNNPQIVHQYELLSSSVWKKNVEVSGVFHFALDYVSYTIRNIYNLPFNESSVLPSWLEGVGCIYLSTAASPSNTCWFITSSSMTSRDCSGSMTLLHCALLRREWGVTDYIAAFIPARDDDLMYFSNLNERLLFIGQCPKRVKQRAP